MDLILVTDIYGYTPHVAAIVDELSCFFSATAVVDPYEGRYLDCKSEQEAYEQFQKLCGIDKLTGLVERAVQSGGSNVIAVGFSVGGTALWEVTSMEVSRRIEMAICFYGSRIREKTYIDPCCETIVVFPRHEDQYDVKDLHDMISGRKNITCFKTVYLHGYMNQLSKNFDMEGYRTCMDRLKHFVGTKAVSLGQRT